VRFKKMGRACSDECLAILERPMPPEISSVFPKEGGGNQDGFVKQVKNLL